MKEIYYDVTSFKLWAPPAGRPAAVAVLAAAAEAAWADDTLAGIADSGTTLADGTELFVGRISFAAEGPAFSLPPGVFARENDIPDSRRLPTLPYTEPSLLRDWQSAQHG